MTVFDECNADNCNSLLVTGVVTTNTECGNENGSATISVVGDENDFDFNWSNGNIGNSINNLAGGSYQVTITNPISIGCDTILNIIIENTNGPDITIVSTNSATCNDTDGTATLSPTTLDYSWTLDGAFIGTGAIQNNLSAGIYEVIATDANGCIQALNVEIEQTSTLSASVDILSPAECGEANGSASLTITNGSGNYDIPNWGTSLTRNDLAAGPYEISITDTNTGCTTTVSFTITDNVPEAILTINSITPVSCLGNTDGAVDYELNLNPGFIGSGTVTIIDMDANEYQSGNLPVGDYCLIVMDDNGCLAGESCFTITAPETLSLALATTNGDCNQPSDISADITGGTSPYTFDWADLAGNDNVQNRNNLNTGSYSLTVTDANGCTVNSGDISIIDDCISTDTIHVSTPFELPTDTICLDLSEIGSNINRVTICEEPKFGVINPMSDSCLVYTPIGGFIGTDTACVVICNAEAICDTTIIIINVGSPDPCTEEIFMETDTATVISSNCLLGGEFCVDIPFFEINNYSITNNGIAYTDATLGCAIDSVINYSTFTFPLGGNVGPYILETWMFNNISYETTFMNIPELVDSMNVWDSTSNWSYDPNRAIISGGDLDNVYGILSVRQVTTNAFTMVDINVTEMPMATSLLLTDGFHELIFTDNLNGCVDTLWVNVHCITTDYVKDTLDLNQTEQICLDLGELIGEVVSIENSCEDASGVSVAYDIDEGAACIDITTFEEGIEEACIVVCDDQGICDTTFIQITVIQDLANLVPPIASTDNSSTNRNMAVDIAQLINDTINGRLDTIIIMEQPQNGIVGINEDLTVKYTPNDGYCDPNNPDVFSYIICNQIGCDSTEVFVTVYCDEIIIFNGFSPNNDGVNDYFKIQGIEAFPNSQLLVFNRWGNEVYRAKGYLNNWDGTWKSDKLLPDGTYFYVLEDGEGKRYSGYIQIHR